MTAPRTYLDYLVDILAAIDDIEAFTRGLDELSFTIACASVQQHEQDRSGNG